MDFSIQGRNRQGQEFDSCPCPLKHILNRNDKSEHITHLDNVVRIIIVWSEWSDSNARPREPKSRALPTALHPDIHFSAIIPRQAVKIKIFLSVVIYVVKAAFVPPSATGGNPANAGAARLCGVSPCPVPDTATALPNQARYQLRYTQILLILE